MADQPFNDAPATTPMRFLLLVASVLVLIIGLPLYIAPTKTALLFSWISIRLLAQRRSKTI